MSNHTQPRKPAGSPDGGQFAAVHGDESTLNITAMEVSIACGECGHEMEVTRHVPVGQTIGEVKHECAECGSFRIEQFDDTAYDGHVMTSPFQVVASYSEIPDDEKLDFEGYLVQISEAGLITEDVLRKFESGNPLKASDAEVGDTVEITVRDGSHDGSSVWHATKIDSERFESDGRILHQDDMRIVAVYPYWGEDDKTSERESMLDWMYQ